MSGSSSSTSSNSHTTSNSMTPSNSTKKISNGQKTMPSATTAINSPPLANSNKPHASNPMQDSTLFKEYQKNKAQIIQQLEEQEKRRDEFVKQLKCKRIIPLKKKFVVRIFITIKMTSSSKIPSSDKNPLFHLFESWLRLCGDITYKYK